MLKGYFCPKHKDSKIFENHLNPVMLVFIGLLSLSTMRVSIIFKVFCINLYTILAKLATSSIRVKLSHNFSESALVRLHKKNYGSPFVVP